jgi:hypothetical protein
MGVFAFDKKYPSKDLTKSSPLNIIKEVSGKLGVFPLRFREALWGSQNGPVTKKTSKESCK